MNIPLATSDGDALRSRSKVALHNLCAREEPRADAASHSLYVRDGVASHSLYARSGVASHQFFARRDAASHALFARSEDAEDEDLKLAPLDRGDAASHNFYPGG